MGKRNGKGGGATLEQIDGPTKEELEAYDITNVEYGDDDERIRSRRVLTDEEQDEHDAEIASMIGDTEVPEVRRIPLVDLAESPKNKRHFYDDAALDQLGESMRVSGQTTPILVRPLGPNHSGPFEIAAGHRRFRAAKRAGLNTLLAIVREMDDALFLEILTVENLQREDIHALDEAELFAQMQLDLGWDVERIATRMKKSTTYVYDALAMRTLIDPIREIFFAGHPGFTRAHAVELARLTSEQQQQAIAHPNYGQASGLWAVDSARYDDDQVDIEMEGDDARASYAGLKPRSVRELKSWIREQCRLDPAAESIPIDFPETATELEEVEVKAEPMVEITDHRQLTPEQKAGSKILTQDKWRESEAGACEHTVRGFHSIGSRRGAVHYICAAKRKCRTHWGDEIRAKEQAAKAAEGGDSDNTSRVQSLTPAELKQVKREEAAAAAREARRVALTLAMPAIEDGVLAALGKVKPLTLLRTLLTEAEEDLYVREEDEERLLAKLPAKDEASAIRRLVCVRAMGDGSMFGVGYGFEQLLPHFCERFGIDLKKIVEKAMPKPGKPKATKATKAPAKKAAKKKGKRA